MIAAALVWVVLGVQAAPESLTIDSALALARAHRGLIDAGAAQTAAARAEYRALGAVPNPLASYQYTGDPPRRHAVLDQPLDWLFRRGSDRAAGRAGVSAARADSALLTLQVEREARSAFYAALGAARLLALAEEEADLADTLGAIATRRRAAGEISELEQSQALVEALRARQQVSLGREARALAAAELSRALGVDREPLAPPGGPLDRAVDQPLPDAPPVATLPAVVRAWSDSAAARARYRAAQWGRVPFPSFQAGVEWNDPTDATRGATILIGFSLPLPLWQTGGAPAAAARARAADAAARLREARAEGAAALAQVGVRVTEAAARARTARDSIFPLARRQRELAFAAYRAGDTGIIPLLDALRAERQVSRDLVSDLVAFQQAWADWLALVAGNQ